MDRASELLRAIASLLITAESAANAMEGIARLMVECPELTSAEIADITGATERLCRCDAKPPDGEGG